MPPTFSSTTSRHSRTHSQASGPLPEVPVQGTGSPTDSASVPSFISRIWGALQRVTRRPLQFATIPVNGTGVGCIENERTIKVVKSDAVVEGQPVHHDNVIIHAHEVAITTSVDGQDKARHYAVGQSPPKDTCLDFVLQGAISGRGLFQFVSRKAHHKPGESSVEPMSSMLKRLVDKAHRSGEAGVSLDGRYTLTDIDNGIDDGGTATHFTLTIHDGRSQEDAEEKPLTISLMQAGLQFSGKLLVASNIKLASDLLEQCTSAEGGASSEQCDPLILSTAGHGRNAVLMTYREIVRQIDDKIVKNYADLEAALEAVISKGREIRSPHFVHSEKQLEELYLALKKKLPAGGASPVMSVPRAIARAQSLRSIISRNQQPSSLPADVPEVVAVPNAQKKPIDIQKPGSWSSRPIPNSKIPSPGILKTRREEIFISATNTQLVKVLNECNLKLDGNIIKLAGDKPKKSLATSIEHDDALLLAIRDMRIYGKSIEATSLFNVLEKNIVSQDKDSRMNAFRKALLEPIRLSPDGDTYESYFFPSKTLADSTIQKMGSKKAALFKQQNALYLEHLQARGESEIDVPLKAFFSKEATVNSYRAGKHLKARIRQLNPCTVSSKNELYFASQAEPDQSVYDVHVDFANSSLGGDWKGDGSFAQEEVAFIENVGLGAVASCAQEKAKWLNGFTNHNLPSNQRHYGENFLTRHSDDTPAPILIEGAERVAEFTSYGRDMASLKKCLPTNWLAIAAPDSRGKVKGNSWKNASGDQLRKVFEDIFSTAHAGFTMAKFTAAKDKITAGEDKTLRINTGQLGCGVFGNSLAISTAAQILAAKIVGVDDIVFHHYSDKNEGLPEKIEEIISATLETMDLHKMTAQKAIISILENKEFKNLI